MISIIVPIYNEEKALLRNQTFFKKLSRQGELIFSDGGSSDHSLEIAAGLGKVLGSCKGRSQQMNHAAQSATADILLFLHADNLISDDVLPAILKQLQDQDYLGGCLTQRIDKPGLMYRLIESFGNFRARLSKIFYGDQGIFVRKDIFLKLQGFPQVPIMEDVIFSKKLRRLGKTAVLPNKILVSPRRWEQRGILRTMLFYSRINVMFWLKLPLVRIKSLYEDLR